MKVLIADDQSGVRSALRFLLEQEAGNCVVTEVVDGDSLLSHIARSCPDIIILDAELDGLIVEQDRRDGKPLQQFICDLRAICPKVKIIALTSRPEIRRIAKDCRADLLVSKTDPPETLLDVIKKLCSNSTA